MNKKFITTEDQKGNIYNINISNIVLIEESESKYFRIITINEVNEEGNFRKIESIHSIKELTDMIKETEF